MPRCPNGTRKNKSGDCVSTGASTKTVRSNGTRKNTNTEEKQHARDYKAAEKLFKQELDTRNKRFALYKQRILIEEEFTVNMTEKKRKSLKAKLAAIDVKMDKLLDKLDKISHSSENQAIYNRLSLHEFDELADKYQFNFDV